MKKSLQGTFLIILFIAATAFITSCKKGEAPVAPVPEPVINPILSELNTNSVTVGGRLATSNFLSEVGFCFSSTNPKPTVDDIFIKDTVAASWTTKITGLTANTTYYIRAYAAGDGGTGYSSVTTFKTNATAAVPTGTVTTFAGSPTGTPGYADGVGIATLFDAPNAIAFNAATGLLYVGDSFNNALRTISLTGTTSTISDPTIGLLNGNAAQARYYGVKGMSFDGQGNAYLADLGNNVIRKITAANAQVSTLAGTSIPGYKNGEGNVAQFFNPSATVVDATGNVFVADRSNNLIRKITPAGVTSVFAGYVAPSGYSQTNVPGYNDATGTDAYFNYPVALTKDAADNIYVADYKNKAIRKITPAGAVSTYAGGPYFSTLIGNPTGVVMDAQGNLFISETSGRILEITKDMVLYVIAGSSSRAGYVNGVGAEARFSSPQALTIDTQGNLYVADFNNNAIRKITVAVQ
jgi:sugar lactone lactonase YvrE